MWIETKILNLFYLFRFRFPIFTTNLLCPFLNLFWNLHLLLLLNVHLLLPPLLLITSFLLHSSSVALPIRGVLLLMNFLFYIVCCLLHVDFRCGLIQYWLFFLILYSAIFILHHSLTFWLTIRPITKWTLLPLVWFWDMHTTSFWAIALLRSFTANHHLILLPLALWLLITLLFGHLGNLIFIKSNNSIIKTIPFKTYFRENILYMFL